MSYRTKTASDQMRNRQQGEIEGANHPVPHIEKSSEVSPCILPAANHPAKISGSYERRSDPKIGGSGDVIVGVRLTFATTQEPRSTAVDDRMKRSDVNRCSGCRKKVRLMGFWCRCGEMLCSERRYSDRHDCSYDYKAAGRDAIARENPMVRAAKILKV
ncbi:hypothetical protein LXL04_037164 [Taraxacum kok-saghyz]